MNTLQYTRDYLPEIFVICIHFFQWNKFTLKIAKLKYSQLYWCIKNRDTWPTNKRDKHIQCILNFVYVEHNTYSWMYQNTALKIHYRADCHQESWPTFKHRYKQLEKWTIQFQSGTICMAKWEHDSAFDPRQWGRWYSIHPVWLTLTGEGHITTLRNVNMNTPRTKDNQNISASEDMKYYTF